MHLDTRTSRAFNEAMAESWASGNRVFIEDSRDNGSFLRVTWHPDGQQFVVSHWRDEVCLAATRVDPGATPNLIALLAHGLGEAAAAPISSSGVVQPDSGWWERFRAWLSGRSPVRRSRALSAELDDLRRSA